MRGDFPRDALLYAIVLGSGLLLAEGAFVSLRIYTGEIAAQLIAVPPEMTALSFCLYQAARRRGMGRGRAFARLAGAGLPATLAGLLVSFCSGGFLAPHGGGLLASASAAPVIAGFLLMGPRGLGTGLLLTGALALAGLPGFAAPLLPGPPALWLGVSVLLAAGLGTVAARRNIALSARSC
jgi:hypothetical protein